MEFKLVEITLQIPEGSEDFVKMIVCRELHEWVTQTKKAEVEQIDAEIRSKIKLVKEANGLIASKISSSSSSSSS